MARGWESKSVEAQQEDAAQNKTAGRPLLTPEEADRERELISLHLSLKRVIEQLGAGPNPRRRMMLELAQNDLERKIETLDTGRSSHQAS